ncbi:NADH (or F420H2) dehydrogenase, subunit C [Oscillochloris trichoides DG-6]|uniref:NADH-quinone oxidoreductase subunit C n=1 Tax=Oscillochloris trichoides DG-6 TaxID=765420 RepID=E1IHT0_9CHLR|nr:NADH-quinone oxidoreductase subunit C [Oscillochloris trichoides]EFO79267.1 NADH (or F420H2) dehydrogenase, subunit C [Oscillochloris trichoides DG-6]
MPQLSAEELRTRMRRDLPGAVLEAAPLQIVPPAHGSKGPFVTPDVLVEPTRLLDAALYLRDQVGYTYLSDIAVVDYLTDNLLEVVYRFYHLDGGPSLALKVRLSRENPELPSLTPHWPGANFHEREAYDLYGVVFTGHPFLRRIYMWDEFEGFPMRKDFPKQGDKYIGAEE